MPAESSYGSVAGAAPAQIVEEDAGLVVCGLTVPKPELLIDWKSASDRQAVQRNQESDEERHITWSELFFDLVFVSAVARIGDDLRGEDRAEYLAISDYMILFLSIYSLWERNVMYSTRFYQDDVFNKIWFSAVMIGVVVLAVHATGGMHGESIQLFCLTRAALSFIVHLPWANVALQIHKYSGHAVSMCIVGVLETVLYAAAGYVPVEYRKYLMLMSVCVLQLQFTRVLLARATKGWVPFPSAPSPVDIEHLSERYGLFFVIVLGESINGISLNVDKYPLTFYLAGLFGFFNVLTAKLLYFDVDVKAISQHAMRRSVYSAISYMWLHYALFSSVALAGSGVAMMCDMAGAETEDGFRDPERARWYLAGALGVQLISLSLIRIAHVPPGADLPDEFGAKPFRMAMAADTTQIVFGIIGCCLPAMFDKDEMSNEAMMGTLAAFAFGNMLFNVFVRRVLESSVQAADEKEAADEALARLAADAAETGAAGGAKKLTAQQLDGQRRRARRRSSLRARDPAKSVDNVHHVRHGEEHTASGLSVQVIARHHHTVVGPEHARRYGTGTGITAPSDAESTDVSGGEGAGVGTALLGSDTPTTRAGRATSVV